MQGRVISKCNFNGLVVEGFHFSLTMHPRHVKVPVMNWVLKVGPTGFVWRVNLLNSGGLDDHRRVRAVHIKKNKV